MKGLIIILVMFLILPFCSASLGISPAKQVVNFESGLELEYSFNIFANIEQKIELYSAGDFADLVEFDKKELIGGGGFKVKIRLPDKIEKPGEHRILIGAIEKFDEEGMGGQVAVQAPIVIIVPYPGKYAEISFSVNNANVGEAINFEVGVASMGEEPITATTNIEIYSIDDKKIEIFNLGTKEIENQKKDVFKKSLDTTNYQPGDYEAIAVVDYQASVAKENRKFRVGHLFVNVTNYTSEIIKQGIQPFEIEVESLWNDPIESVYAEVLIVKDNKNISVLQTPSVNLVGWQKKILLGYVDTDKLKVDEYDLKIVAHYAGNFTAVDGKLNVVKESNLIIYLLIAGIIMGVVILGIGLFYVGRKHAKKK